MQIQFHPFCLKVIFICFRLTENDKMRVKEVKNVLWGPYKTSSYKSGRLITALWLIPNFLYLHFITFVEDTKYTSHLIFFIQCQYTLLKWNRKVFYWSTCCVNKGNECLFKETEVRKEEKTLPPVASNQFHPGPLPLYPARP